MAEQAHCRDQADHQRRDGEGQRKAIARADRRWERRRRGRLPSASSATTPRRRSAQMRPVGHGRHSGLCRVVVVVVERIVRRGQRRGQIAANTRRRAERACGGRAETTGAKPTSRGCCSLETCPNALKSGEGAARAMTRLFTRSTSSSAPVGPETSGRRPVVVVVTPPCGSARRLHRLPGSPSGGVRVGRGARARAAQATRPRRVAARAADAADDASSSSPPDETSSSAPSRGPARARTPSRTRSCCRFLSQIPDEEGTGSCGTAVRVRSRPRPGVRDRTRGLR